VIQRRLIALAAAAAGSLALSGCITIFPKATPVQLYRFGAEPPKVVVSGAPFNLTRSAIIFSRPSQSDAILTTNGAQTAYIAGARWVAPAVVLFEEAVDRAFDEASGPARVVPRGEIGRGGASLKLEVESFEARYPGEGSGVAPLVVVSVHALLVRASDRGVIAEKTFEVQRAAEADRVSAIVRAFNDATSDAIGQIVTWTEQEGEATATPETAAR
jgi:cholesterol transport system auxiliary component